MVAGKILSGWFVVWRTQKAPRNVKVLKKSYKYSYKKSCKYFCCCCCSKLQASVWVFNDSSSEWGNERNDEAPIISVSTAKDTVQSLI